MENPIWHRQGMHWSYPYGWQQPVKTEQWVTECYLSRYPEQRFIQFIGFPWATLIDCQRKHQQERARLYLDALAQLPPKMTIIRATAMQHIYAQDLWSMLKRLKFTDVFWSHATNQVQQVDGIRIHPLPLYPVCCAKGNLKPETTPSLKDRRYLYGFIGTYDALLYLTPVRQWLFELPPAPDGLIEPIDAWHYEKTVYQEQIAGAMMSSVERHDQQEREQRYRDVLQQTVFSLCPSGSGSNSIRLWESLGAGCIPVLMADTLRLPGTAAEWDQAIVRIPENRESIRALPKTLRQLSQNEQNMRRMRQNCVSLWRRYGLESDMSEVQQVLEKSLRTSAKMP